MKISSQKRYRILGLVGSGQFGRVFCARDRQTNQLVALKELEPRKFPTSNFLRELRLLISLSHINIVSCISLDYSQNRRYLVMEYCEAGTLRNLMDGLIDMNLAGRSPHSQLSLKLNLVIDILSGLQYAHSLNIVHCDLKPENILLKLTALGWQPKISDFGIAKVLQDGSEYDNSGSPAYMAPERFYGQFSLVSDLYAVGIILYELLVGDRPFLGNPTKMMFAHINQKLKVPDYIPKALKNFLYKSLEKLPARRFSSAEKMQEELRLILAQDLLPPRDLPSHSFPELFNDFEVVKKFEITPNSIDVYSSGRQSPDSLVDFGFVDYLPNTSFFYSATEYLLERKDLGSIFNNSFSIKFNAKIIAVEVTGDKEFVITRNSIYRVTNNFQNQQILYSSHAPEQKFYWAIADQWLAIVNQWEQDFPVLRLQIQYLSGSCHLRIIDLPTTSVVALIKITNHHLALITNTEQGCNICVISRRGCLMGKYDLPMTISMAIASYEGGRILLATNLNYLVLVDWKPYRIYRVDIDYKPELIKATKWGYIATCHGESTTLLNFMDIQCNNVGVFVVTGFVEAIACYKDHILIISVRIQTSFSGNTDNLLVKPLILDLKQLDLDLVF